MKTRKQTRMRRSASIRSKIRGTAECPRLSVFKSHTRMYVQIIDDDKRVTIASLYTQGKNQKSAQTLGENIAKKAINAKITRVVFDRAGFRYHGAIKTLADSARGGGLVF
jgi:large subunit ribosomal protein L18